MVSYNIFNLDYLLDPNSIPCLYAVNPSLTPSVPH
jgi:hypothetical protein